MSAVLGEPAPSNTALTLLSAELQRRLAAHPAGVGESVRVATPARADVAGLGAVLEILRGLSLAVDGFVDAATVSAAGLGIAGGAIVLELGMHHVAATAVERDGAQVRRRRTVVSQSGGYLELCQMWLDFISTAMVKRTRFDPLHDAATEQQLFDSLETLAREAARTGAATAALTRGNEERFEVALTRDQFALAAQPIYREIVRLLHELRPAGVPVALIMPLSVAQLPGLTDELEQFVGCELVTLPEGFAASATSLLDVPPPPAAGSVRLLRHLPVSPLPELAAAATREVLGRRRSSGPAPSHLLLEGHAHAFGADALVVGRAPAASRAITLPEGLAGVSRRHCTFMRDGDGIVLLDHSSYGTYVNGERVVERVRVYAGDRVRVGEPGVELALIAVGGGAS
jgi:hypothetical protein